MGKEKLKKLADHVSFRVGEPIEIRSSGSGVGKSIAQIEVKVKEFWSKLNITDEDFESGREFAREAGRKASRALGDGS